jgi:hypothetical protein
MACATRCRGIGRNTTRSGDYVTRNIIAGFSRLLSHSACDFPALNHATFCPARSYYCPRDDSNVRHTVEETDDGPGRRECLCNSLKAIVSPCKELRQSGFSPKLFYCLGLHLLASANAFYLISFISYRSRPNVFGCDIRAPLPAVEEK